MQVNFRLHYSWIVLVVGTLVVFGALGLARFGYTVVLPAMQVSLSMDNTQAGVLATANLIGYLALSVLGGALAARFGPRRVIAVGLILAAAGMLLTSMVNAILSAALWRAVTGIGSGASNVPVMALLAAWFSSRRRGLATGIAATGSSIGLIVVGPLVPRILATFVERGWRVSWLLFGGATLVIALLAWLLLRDRPEDVGLEPLGETEKNLRPVDRTGALDWGRVYRAAEVWHLGLVYVAFGFSYIIYLTFFTKFLISEGGYTPARAGGLFMTMGWFSLLCGLVWGAVSDVIGRKRTLTIVYLFHALAFSMFGLWRAPIGFTISAILFGVTAWSIPAIMAATCGDVLGPRLAPAALGFITLFFGVGQAIGPSVAGAMADASGTFVSAYLLAAFVAVLGAIGSLRLRPASTTAQPAAQIFETGG
ncbi:MAG TPA: MFS transporter [Anaerolineales bacterium]